MGSKEVIIKLQTIIKELEILADIAYEQELIDNIDIGIKAAIANLTESLNYLSQGFWED